MTLDEIDRRVPQSAPMLASVSGKLNHVAHLNLLMHGQGVAQLSTDGASRELSLWAYEKVATSR